jgi:hypothetical protein
MQKKYHQKNKRLGMPLSVVLWMLWAVAAEVHVTSLY